MHHLGSQFYHPYQLIFRFLCTFEHASAGEKRRRDAYVQQVLGRRGVKIKIGSFLLSLHLILMTEGKIYSYWKKSFEKRRLKYYESTVSMAFFNHSGTVCRFLPSNTICKQKGSSLNSSNIHFSREHLMRWQ